MTLAGIPRSAFLAAANLPENASSRNALLRLAGERLGPSPALVSSEGLEGEQGGSEGVRKARGKVPRTEGLDSLTLTLYGSPRTKKTSNQLQRFGGRLKVVPSAAWMRWRDECLKQVDETMRLRDQPYNLCAIFYRDADRGDLIGFIQGVADVLQEAEIISDDRYFVSLDGTRLRVDREWPRVELEIRPAPGE